MKQSRFNVIDKDNQPTLVYNSYSGAIVALDAEYEKALFANGANGLRNCRQFDGRGVVGFRRT